MGKEAMTTKLKFTKYAGLGNGTYWRSDVATHRIRAYLRDLELDGLWKSAAVGDSESGFEQAFSSLAYAYLKDKAPRLLDFMVGFQLVDRNEDNTKAMGIFGFQIGTQWLYAPVFFLNGDLKGHELLYIKNQDTFVPLKENWVNYLMSRKPHVLGEASKKDTHQLGGLMPDIYSMKIPPMVGVGKRGCDDFDFTGMHVDDWAKPAMPLIAAMQTKSAGFMYASVKPNTKLAMDCLTAAPKQAALIELARQLDLNAIMGSSFDLLKSAFDLAESYPVIKRGFDKFYGADCFSRWGVANKARLEEEEWQLSVPVKTAADKKPLNGLLIPEVELPEHPIKSGSLRIYVYESYATTRNVDELDQKDREKLLKDTVLIKDERDPHGPNSSKAYNTQVPQSLSNPSESGIYSVLEKPGEFARMLVISHPLANDGQKDFCTLVRLDGGDTKTWLNAHSTSIWVNQIKTEREEKYQHWWDGLGDKDSLRVGGTYIAINARGNGSVPFEVRQNYGDGTYKVDFKAHGDYSYGRLKSLPSVGRTSRADYVSTWGAKLVIGVEGKHRGNQFRAIQGELRVPPSAKFLKLKDPPKPREEEGERGFFPIRCCEDTGSKEKPIQPGNLEDIQTMFSEKTAAMKITTDRSQYIISTKWAGDQTLTGVPALVSLVRDHGFTEDMARTMLKEAEAYDGMRCRVIYGEGFGDKRHMTKSAEPNQSILEGGPGAPQWSEPQVGMEQMGRNQVQARYPDEQYNLVPGLDSTIRDRSRQDMWENYTAEDFKKTVGQAQQAAQQGQKEVFDTSMIAGLLKSVRQDSLVDRYLGDLLKALDRLGRIMFVFYWHQQEFEDRYGKSDLPELEDSLRNSFEALGDITLYLRKKSVNPTFEGDNAAPNIEEIANA